MMTEAEQRLVEIVQSLCSTARHLRRHLDGESLSEPSTFAAGFLEETVALAEAELVELERLVGRLVE